ncbi:MAG: hypothetical protein QME58_14420, partial [Bacteroidota bacterium]|nr:hypothetical protein [Bacteroidota bacterium]
WEPGERKILKINENNTIDTIPWIGYRRIHSTWFEDEKRIFTSGSGVFIRRPDKHWQEMTELPLYGTDRVRGISTNDVFVVGSYGLVAHYNGLNWHVYPEAATAQIYYSCDYKNNIMVAVGERYSRAVALIMRKR